MKKKFNRYLSHRVLLLTLAAAAFFGCFLIAAAVYAVRDGAHALLAAVGVMELMLYSRSIVSLTGNMTPYIVAACFYLIVTLPLIRVVGNLEKRLALADSGGTAPKKKRRKNRRGAFTQMREEITVSTEQAAEVLQEQERLEAHLDDGSEPADMDQALDELQDGIALDAQITDADERGGSR